MHNKINLLTLLLFLLVSACSTTSQWTKLSKNAHQEFSNQEYASALQMYEEYFVAHNNNPTQIPDTLYRNAGIAAYRLGQTQKALDFLNLIRHSDIAHDETQYVLALANREINNLSREITALETYVNKFPFGPHIEEMRQRLFQTYVESQNYDKAIALWPDIEENAQDNESLLNDYFIALLPTENEQELLDVSDQLITLNPENIPALLYRAEHFFWKAENRYQAEMEAYEKNRTRKQYAQLLRAFEVLNADFRRSLNLFLALYQVDPRPAYARFIGNIYLRFDDKVKAKHYLELSED